MVLRPSRYGPFYGCTRWPDCAASHGAHAATGDPLGTPADKETKAWRIRAHDAFDATWRGKRSRGSAYRALAAYLGISRGKCHIGMFDADLCVRTVQYAENERKNV
jgi:ssDNA-binding Zn-finger/Zn-ribbon topoisomerase 1